MQADNKDSNEFDYGLVNDEQRAAIDHRDNPCVVTAGAGSGKTSVLTKRIAKLVYDGVDPKSILAITFTKKAAEEMKERLEVLIGKEKADKVFLGTFHSFGVRVVFWKYRRAGKNPPQIVLGQDQRQIIEKVLAPTAQICKLTNEIEPDVALSFISWQKNFLIMPNDDLDISCLEDPDSVDDTYIKDLRTVYKAYEEVKREQGVIDFDDMLTLTYLILKKDKEMRNIYQNLYKYILVDEFQDTNVAQYAIVKLLAGGFYQNVFIVGDARQAIYSWRASKVDFILNFAKEWKNARTIELNDNYRSTVEVVDISTEVISHSTIKYPGICRSGRGNHGEPIMSLVTEDADEEAKVIAYLIKYMVEEEKKIGYSDVAILYRLNMQSRPFEDAFIALDIPYHVAGSEGFYGIREIKELLAYLHLAIRPNDSEAFRMVMNVPDRGITQEMFNNIKDLANEYDVSYADIVSQFSTIAPDDDTKKLMSDFGLTLEKLAQMNADPNFTVKDMLNEIVTSMDYYEHLKNRQKKKTKGGDDGGKEKMINSFIQQCKKFATVEALDDHIQKAEEQQADKNKAKVQLMSLHRSKGLEFNTVFMAGMVNGMLPHSKSMKVDKQGRIIPESIEEERRLCYVGVTRAKERLILSSYRKDGKDNADESVFFREIKHKTKDISQVAAVLKETFEGQDGEG